MNSEPEQKKNKNMKRKDFKVFFLVVGGSKSDIFSYTIYRKWFSMHALFEKLRST